MLWYMAEDRILVDKLWPMLFQDKQAVMDKLRLYPSAALRVVLAPTEKIFAALISDKLSPHQVLGVYASTHHTIYLRAPRTRKTGLWDLRGVLRHELAHAVIDLGILHPVPIWLHEGLAILVSEELSFLDEAGLTLRAVGGRLIPLRRLFNNFPGRQQQRQAAYSQAASFIRFLLAREGMGGVHLLLATLSEGVPLYPAFNRVYGDDLPTLEREWSTGLTKRFSWATLVTTSTLLGGLGVPLVLIALARRYLKNRTVQLRWKREALPPESPVSPAGTADSATDDSSSDGSSKEQAPEPPDAPSDSADKIILN